MTWFEFEGRRVPIEAGDTIASALFRAGVRTFSRSFKYHRPRGLYCLTGDCPNCLMTVDGEPAVRACATPAASGQRVARGGGWPSPDFDLLAGLWHLRWLLPVGFYYKTMHRPRWVWPLAERVIRRLAGTGVVPRNLPPADRERQYHHPDLCVVGGGPAGLAAARAAAHSGQTVVLADEGRIGEQVPPGDIRTRIDALLGDLRQIPGVTVLEQATAVGIYEGPLVPIAAADFLHLVLPRRIVVATGAVERHPVFPGNDLPGVWLGRGAERLAGVHGLAPGRRIVFAGATRQSIERVLTLQRSGAEIAACLFPSALAARVKVAGRVIADGEVVAARGRNRLTSVVVESPHGREQIACDALVLSLGLVARDSLLRQAEAEPVMGAGEAVAPGCDLDAALESGRGAARGLAAEPWELALPPAPQAGCVCLCEDISAKDLAQAWDEGFQSTELLKRYTTATMGPCQGALCHAHLRSLVAARAPASPVSRPTTARPPARPVRLEDLAAGARYPLEYHTGLHDRHLELGATMEWAGVWKRPESYGDVLAEYWAVRQRASIMDVSTLGKYRVAGPDATEFLERLYPCHVENIKPGRSRYALLLNEAGYAFDDGLICSLGPEGYYLTLTSGGADQAESWLRDWAETWSLRVHVANLTATLGAINVAGPKARELLASLCRDPLDSGSFPYSQHRWIEVAGVRCLALRVGFVGELSYELHHPRLESVRLWDALLAAGRRFEVKPHGLEALRLLRLEKGHVIVGQDTDFDSTPSKLGMDWAVKLEKPEFVGKTALQRIAALERDRGLVGFVFPGGEAPAEGAQLLAGGARVGYLTSARFSPVLGQGIGLGWVWRQNGGFPATVEAVDGAGAGRRLTGTAARLPFYDPEGARLRG